MCQYTSESCVSAPTFILWSCANNGNCNWNAWWKHTTPGQLFYFNKCTVGKRDKKTRAGRKWMWSCREGTMLNDMSKENVASQTRSLPWGITQLDFRLFFSSPCAHLIPAPARVFSFICFIPAYCHNVAGQSALTDHCCSLSAKWCCFKLGPLI